MLWLLCNRASIPSRIEWSAVEWSGITVLAELQHESERQRCNRNSMRLRLQLKEQTSLWKAEGISQASSFAMLSLAVIVWRSGSGGWCRAGGVAIKNAQKVCTPHWIVQRLSTATCDVQRAMLLHPSTAAVLQTKREREREGGGRGTGLSCNYSPDPLTRSFHVPHSLHSEWENESNGETRSRPCRTRVNLI